MLVDNRMPYADKKDLAPDVYSIASSNNPSTSMTSPLPTKWVLAKTKKGLLKSTLNITSPDGTQHNAVSTHTWHSGITIHSTSSQDSEPLVTAKTHFKDFRVQIPSQGIDIKTKTHWWKTSLPRVEWEMATNEGTEHFEWESSYGSWKLTRRGANGEEVVARWICSFSSTRLSGEFEFMGSGATGLLGGQFQLVAAAVAMAMGKYARDAAAGSAAAVASSSSAAAAAAAS